VPQVDPDVGAVVVGWDPNFSYSRLVYASICLRELPGCLLVATNTDCADHIGGGRMMPGTGGLVRAVEVASGATAVGAHGAGPCHAVRGGGGVLHGYGEMAGLLRVCRTPNRVSPRNPPPQVNVAKGGEWLLPYLCRTYGLDPTRTAIIGDRMDTDIFLGRQGGLATCLPLTGVTTLERLAALPPAERPDVVVRSVAQLAGLA
jgi:ribonucleotide monophosphatase NagD (HAD superfamily)